MQSDTLETTSTILNATVPVIDINNFFNKGPKYLDECKRTADAFHNYGCIIIKDPRVNESHNNEFVDMLEQYFQRRSEKFYKEEPVEDIFPETGYQTGATPEFIEKARNHCEFVKTFATEHKPMSECPPAYDAKWRFFWRIGEKPSGDRMIDPPKTIPKDFENWETIMDRWGNLMLDACFTVAEMTAIGLDLEPNTFKDKMIGGTHLLAPTGSDLEKYEKGTVFAGFHYGI